MSSKPKFTKQHYEMIADALHNAMPEDRLDPLFTAFATVCDNLLNLFRNDNPKFRAQEFVERILYGKK